ncbi:MAG: enoyl-CoA hydratase/isomerase family protein [Candidatus Kapaibacterium sp.]
MEYSTIIFEKKENYAIIKLNRPDKLNALNKQMFDDMDSALKAIENDREVHALIITGMGEKAFAAGADIEELNKSDDRSGKIFSEYGSYVMKRMEQLKIPVIAAVNGFALGGGCELALAAHIRFASNQAKFGQPEVNLGIIPGYGGTQRLPRIVGKAKAMELIISGNTIDADEALHLGLVNSVYSPDVLMAETEKFVLKVLSKGKQAVSNAVQCVNKSEELSLLEGLAFESDMFGRTCGTEDFAEGTKAFLEKRKPDFR